MVKMAGAGVKHGLLLTSTMAATVSIVGNCFGRFVVGRGVKPLALAPASALASASASALSFDMNAVFRSDVFDRLGAGGRIEAEAEAAEAGAVAGAEAGAGEWAGAGAEVRARTEAGAGTGSSCK